MKPVEHGIRSCKMFGVVVLCLLGVGASWYLLRDSEGRGFQQVPWLLLAFLCGLAAWMLSFLGVCYGLAGLSRQQKSRTAAATGVVLNGLVFLAIVGRLLWVLLRT